jgi:hypothetical protein
MAFVKSATNGLLVYIPDRAVMLKLPAAFRTEQNGHLFQRDVISGDVLVQATVAAPPTPEEFKGVPMPQAVETLQASPEVTRAETKKKKKSQPQAEEATSDPFIGA